MIPTVYGYMAAGQIAQLFDYAQTRNITEAHKLNMTDM